MLVFNFPPSGDPYNPLQQLTYFGVVFLLGPFMIATGVCDVSCDSVSISKISKIFRGRQTARSLHFLGLLAFILFIIVHIIMVTVERFPENMGNIVLGNGGKGTSLGRSRWPIFSFSYNSFNCTCLGHGYLT